MPFTIVIPPDWFFDVVTEFLGRYDRINTEWRGVGFDRPSRAHDMDVDPNGPSSSQQPPLSVSQKRLREVETVDSHASLTHDATPHVSYKRPRQVETTDAFATQPSPVEATTAAPPVTQTTPVFSPLPSQSTPVSTIPAVIEPTPAPVPHHAHIEAPIPCELAVDSIGNKVANGMSRKIHGKPMPTGCLRVSMDEGIKLEALIPVPVVGEMETVKQAVGSHVAWPKEWIIPRNTEVETTTAAPPVT